MKKQICFLILILLCFCVHAQSTEVYLYHNDRVVSKYEIIYPGGEKGLEEKYAYFKDSYWFISMDSISLEVFTQTDSGYVVGTGKKMRFYKAYEPCHKDINHIRNNAAFWKMEHLVDSVARQNIGINNEYFRKFSQKQGFHWDFFGLYCHSDYLRFQNELQSKLLTCIDSISDAKKVFFVWLSEQKTQVNQEEVDRFLKQFSSCDADFASLEQIIRIKPQLFLQSMYQNNSHNVMYALKHFPKNIDLKDAIAAVKNTKNRDPIKREILKALKHQKKSFIP